METALYLPVKRFLENLGFTVKVPFVDGVRRIVKWLDDNGRIPSADTAPWYDRIIAAWERHGAGMATELRDADGPFRP